MTSPLAPCGLGALGCTSLPSSFLESLFPRKHRARPSSAICWPGNTRQGYSLAGLQREDDNFISVSQSCYKS